MCVCVCVCVCVFVCVVRVKIVVRKIDEIDISCFNNKTSKIIILNNIIIIELKFIFSS